MIRVVSNPHGPRLYVLKGARLHHGLLGAVLTVIGFVLMLHDRRDAPWPLRDKPEISREETTGGGW